MNFLGFALIQQCAKGKLRGLLSCALGLHERLSVPDFDLLRRYNSQRRAGNQGCGRAMLITRLLAATPVDLPLLGSTAVVIPAS
jgi:hypothetical protein